ncbi:MAG TPA: hypothetical protein VFW88_06925 [Burkholderiales bacterium]|nr:hypothetical protein [Burkholderiales bacterium]
MSYAARLLAVVIVFLPMTAIGAAPLSAHQRWALVTAYRESGYLAPTFAAILAQESSLCVQKISVIDRKSRGCGGLHVKTARMFISDVTGDALIHDDALNIRISARYLRWCDRHTRSWSAMVCCYHYGLPATVAMGEACAHSRYVQRIRKRRAWIIGLVAQLPRDET